MRLLRRLRAYRAIAPRGRRNRTDALRFLFRRPALLAAIGGYETAVLVSNRVELRLKYLATLRASGIVGCPF
jgi:hypothetical protein